MNATTVATFDATMIFLLARAADARFGGCLSYPQADMTLTQRRVVQLAARKGLVAYGAARVCGRFANGVEIIGVETSITDAGRDELERLSRIPD